MRITYLDVAQEDIKADNAELLGEIEERGLLFPVTVIDNVPVYDGAVSYPAIMRAVQTRLDAVEA